MQLSLDKSSPTPLYAQLASQLACAIANGAYEPGNLLDGEIELATRLRVSRPTVRQAIKRLVDEGLVVRQRGVGTVVLPRRVRRSNELSSLYDDLVEAGRKPTTTVLWLQQTHAESSESLATLLEPTTPVIRLGRLRSVDGEPLGIMKNELPAGLVHLKRSALETNGLYDCLRQQGIYPQMAEQAISAACASEGQARLLGCPEGTPLLGIERCTYDGFGRLIEHGSHYYRADRYEVDMTLFTNRSG